MRIINILIPIIAIILATVSGSYVWQSYMHSAWTRDGKVKSEITQITADISGRIVKIHVKDNQKVQKGTLLFEIDKRDYQNALNEALSNVKVSQAQLNQALNIEKRDTKLPENLISAEEVTSDILAVEQNKAALDVSKSMLEQAKLNLSRVKIYAPEEGFITNLNQRLGNYVSVNEPLVALVETKSFYVLGYFEEIKLPNVIVGREVLITPLSGLPPFKGVVESIGHAVQDNSANDSGLIPNVTQTIPWVRLSQRIPVRIKITDDLSDTQLIHGTTCSVEILD
ncbi:HlyD family secretion protein [Shewanella gelidimarina]|uniref:efflux RND transporter periplasmic adaptor subunit n=1 Tax=Shewanella gelidimarina TaxID=56813 RepID=UPI00200FA293|nr:HlyD family secretion protein [Shewanella gelidimarina]MCL1057793.1 HlyD family secretion protein [Shewanella gelidimarina]